ncbi:MAG: NADH-quinone oxidoreductase subunit NuoB [Opitutae bacterium]|nr:NADH-quinone oxidoreductase subunit NuoB [Opitutae bacterium]
MIRTLFERLRQKHRTVAYPAKPPGVSDRFRGLPELSPEKCPAGCAECVAACPVGAISREGGAVRLDLGRCLFCGDCAAACPHGALRFTRDHRLAARQREDLVLGAGELKLAAALDAKMKSLFGRSLKLRQVCAGGCGACEADLNVLSTVVFDLGRFGIQFVASPRHADGLLLTGPVTENMALALKKTYDALPEPRLVIAVGACAISGGPYAGHAEVRNGAAAIVAVDLFIPGCPPHPVTILDGLLRLLGRLEVKT